MSINSLNLRKVLQLIMAPAKQRESLLRTDIRSQVNKEKGEDVRGGDFFVPFWASAKAHVRGEIDLSDELSSLISANRCRTRLYPLLATGFLRWWNEKRRWRNESFVILNENIKSQYHFKELDLTVKIENLISAQIGDQSYRLIYPYFSEKPLLTNKGARLGIYLLHRALPQFSVNDFRILDILRSSSFSAQNVKILGTEEDEFTREYMALRQQWITLYEKYV